MLVLGIETSCDETSASVVRDGVNILSNTIASSLSLHKKYGGVVPEIACRHHLECINYVIEESLNDADAKLSDIELVAVTHGPGLTGALLIGISAAKSLSYALNIPMVGVNHLYSHIYSAMINGTNVEFPCIGLIVSGGHTTIILVKDYNKIEMLGQTRDDAAGEAFDKAAKMLGLGYPGGPIIEEKAKAGNPEAIKFPRAYLGKGSFDFSFSGVKTALLYYVRDNHGGDILQHKKKIGSKDNLFVHQDVPSVSDICASFQKAIFDVIVDKTMNACVKERATQILIGGGVSNNKTLRSMFEAEACGKNIKVLFPVDGTGTDNAAMVAAAGYRLFKDGVISDYSLDSEPNLCLG